MGNTHFLLNNIPLLARRTRQPRPDLASHAYVILRQILQLHAIPIIRTAPLHEPLMALPTRIRGLGGEIRLLDGGPIHALGAGRHERLVVLGVPRAGGRADGGERGGGLVGVGVLGERDGCVLGVGGHWVLDWTAGCVVRLLGLLGLVLLLVGHG